MISGMTALILRPMQAISVAYAPENRNHWSERASYKNFIPEAMVKKHGIYNVGTRYESYDVSFNYRFVMYIYG